MAWTTIIDSMTARPGGVTEIVVTFVDDGAGRKVRLTTSVTNPTPDRIRQQLRFERSRIDGMESAKQSIAIGQPINIDIPDASIEPDADVVARVAYQAAYQHFRAVRLQFQDGLVAQKAVDDALAALRALYKAEYLGVL